jgi:6-pyruvoyltetrahydropterin/6-carboxytetrahydropterin synthase
MQAELVRTFRFAAAHALPNVPDEHKCGKLHGHSYRLDVHIVGKVDEHAGWVMDFARIKDVVEPLLNRLDHANLNEIPGLENSTSELLAKWLWDKIGPDLPGLSQIVVWESESARCIYRGA